MTTEIIVLLVLLIIAGLIIFKITKSIFKAIFLASTALTLIILILGSFIVLDANDFRKNFQTQPSIFVLEDDGEISAGFSAVLGEDEFNPDYLLEEKLGTYDPDNLDELLGENYKIFFVKKQALDSVETVEGGDMKLTKEEIFEMIDSETTIDDFVRSQVKDIPPSQFPALKKQMMEQMNINEDAELKGALFGAAFAAAMEDNPLFLFEQYKEGNIIIYPETAMFKFLRKVPLSLLKNMVKVEEVN
ncbi:hypothetical protein GOV06_03965 [Candidatus Woesearchaeota archaeon]|nr:hypothetical protein [Candidatus Woesearchaeota archaeon]